MAQLTQYYCFHLSCELFPICQSRITGTVAQLTLLVGLCLIVGLLIGLGLLLARLYAMFANVGPSAVSPSRGYISKTKQDRPSWHR